MFIYNIKTFQIVTQSPGIVAAKVKNELLDLKTGDER